MKSTLAGTCRANTAARGVRALVSPATLARPEVLVLAPVAAGLALRLAKAWSSVSTLLLETTSDDAFYYLQIARNIAAGHNVTFDGENLTNGFHPLWMALVTPIYFFTDDRELALHVALTMASVLGAGTALLLFAAVRTLTGNGWAALAAASFYALHPYLIAESNNGMETAVAMFTVAATVWLFFRIACRSERASPVDYGVLGVSAGLMVLARTDTAFMLPPLAVALVARERGWRREATTLITGGVALLVVAPWALWSLVTFGTVIQVSGVAVAQLDRRLFLDAHGRSVGIQIDHAWDLTSTALFDRLPHFYFIPHGSPTLPIMITSGAVLAFAVLAPFAPQRRLVTRQIVLLLVPATGVLLGLVFNAAIRWHVREWYFAPMALVGALFLGVMVSYAHSVLRGTRLGWRPPPPESEPGVSPPPVSRPRLLWRRLPVLAPYVVVVLAMAAWYGPTWSGRWIQELPHRLNMLEAARWVADNTEPDARVGSLNAGIIGYFSERTVVNLDGVVNEKAYEARRDRRIREYVREERLGYLVDLRGTVAFARGDGEACPEYEYVTTIGEKLYYFGSGQLDVFRRLPETTAGAEGCPEGPDGGLQPAGEAGEGLP